MRSNKWWLDKKGDCSSSRRSRRRSRRSRRRAAGAMRRNSRWAGDQKLPNAILHFQIFPLPFTDIAGGTTGWLTFPFRSGWLRNKQIPIMSGVTQTKIHQPPFVWVWSSAAQAIFRWHRLHFCSIWTQRWLHIVSSGNVGTSQFALSSILVKGESWCNLVFNDNSCWENLTLEPKDP